MSTVKKSIVIVVVVMLFIWILGSCEIPVVAAPLSLDPVSPGSTNLVACWDLDETSGTRYDYTDNNSDLTDGNTVLYGTGVSGNAADFEADNNEYLVITDNAYLSMGDIDLTITGWIYLESTAQSQQIIWKYSSTLNNREYMFYYDLGSTTFRWAVSGDGVSGTIVVASNFGAPSTDTWYFFTLQHDATNNQVKISINLGTFNSSGHTTGIFDGNSDFSLSRNSSTVDIDGLLDTVTVYKRILTADELTWLYNSGAGRSCAAISPATPTPTMTSTFTNTPTFTHTFTDTPTLTFTPTDTFTHTFTMTASRTFTPTRTFTATETYTPTDTNTPTETNTPTNTFTPRYDVTIAYETALPVYLEIAESNSPLVAVVAALCGLLVIVALVVIAIFVTKRRKP
jgi:hypothetical protein